MMNDSNNDNVSCAPFVIALIMVFILIWSCVSCSSHHYFSINAEEITNPNIQYHDSTTVTNPF